MYCGRSEKRIGPVRVRRILPVDGSRASLTLYIREIRVSMRWARSSFMPDGVAAPM